ncbi:MAG TPA: class I SAM-dependent methyltransferase [Bryobacteraceae bacterium]|jgi:SAM-dependent methyltransferase|nr:class I SAM-dependent methyltransferase [Bryobacteraceae bacterium]
MPFPALDDSILDKMREDWDQRARENARHYIATANTTWSDHEYYESGRLCVYYEILNDLGNVCQHKNPKQMKVLEIGCGTGRMTRALGEVFGEVYGVDISGEMIAQGKKDLADLPNVHLFQNNGADLAVLNDALGDGQIDFAFSYIVFQHIPSQDVIYSYTREVNRLLRPGGLFKFQMQGAPWQREGSPDSWLGVTFTEAEAMEMARECGFEARYRIGAGSQFFWLWFFKQAGA